jgi:hypothetical protein
MSNAVVFAPSLFTGATSGMSYGCGGKQARYQPQHAFDRVGGYQVRRPG